MKTYTFFYFDATSSEYVNVSYKKYVISAPRFDLAYKGFVYFLRNLNFPYINLALHYNVFNGNKNQVRFIKDDDSEFLTRIVNKYGAVIRFNS